MLSAYHVDSKHDRQENEELHEENHMKKPVRIHSQKRFLILKSVPIEQNKRGRKEQSNKYFT